MNVVCAYTKPVVNCETSYGWYLPIHSDTKAHMKDLNWLILLVILNTLLFVMPGGCYRIPALPDNCTCKTNEEIIYSLFPLRRIGGDRARFSGSGFPPHTDYAYTYNPCVPYTFKSPEGICKNVALCRYITDQDPPVYIDIGEQRDVQCEIQGGNISLIYPVQNPNILNRESRMNLECNSDDPGAKPKFTVLDEDKMIFQLKSHCGCPNQCNPPPTIPPKPGPYPSTTPSSEPETTSPRPETPSSRPEGDAIRVIVPVASVLGVAVFVIVSYFTWRYVIKRNGNNDNDPGNDEERDLLGNGAGVQHADVIHNQIEEWNPANRRRPTPIGASHIKADVNVNRSLHA